MAASGYTPIQLYYSTTPSAEPAAVDLVDGELALNTADGKLFYKGISGDVLSFQSGEGASGYSGYSGTSGYSGATGAAGTSGFSGYSGVSGYSGTAGASGISGFSGTSGFSGATGTSGFSGYSGSAGATGTSGFSGYSGSAGATGTSGFSGFSGTSGFSGYSGYSGSAGASGTSGYSGRSGYSGYNGLSGFSGYSGTSGASGISGYSGATGPTTYPGAGIPLSTGSAWDTSFNTTTNPVHIEYGGTGQTSFTTGQVHFGSFVTSSNLFWDNGNIRLGVGTSFPVATLHVRGGNSNNLSIDNAGEQYTTLAYYNNGAVKAQSYYDNLNGLFVTGTNTSTAFVIKTNNSEKARVSAAGGFSVGTASDAGAGNILVSGAYKTANFSIVEESGTLNFYNGATKIMSLDSSGNLTTLSNVTAYGTP